MYGGPQRRDTWSGPRARLPIRGRGAAPGQGSTANAAGGHVLHQEDAQPNEHIDKRRGGVPLVKVTAVTRPRGRGVGRGVFVGRGNGNWRGMGRGRGGGNTVVGGGLGHWQGKGMMPSQPSPASSLTTTANMPIPTGPRKRVQFQDPNSSSNSSGNTGRPAVPAFPVSGPSTGPTLEVPLSDVQTTVRGLERVDVEQSSRYLQSHRSPTAIPASSSSPKVQMARLHEDSSIARVGVVRPSSPPIYGHDGMTPPLKKRKLSHEPQREVMDATLRPTQIKRIKAEPIDVNMGHYSPSPDTSRSSSTSSLSTFVKAETITSHLLKPINTHSTEPHNATIHHRPKQKTVIKLESSPNPQRLTLPPAEPSRRLITQWCTHIPFPDDCRKTHSDWDSNRQKLFRKEWSRLESFGLKKTKLLMRPDGMVIEWTSPIPVWSDTYLPSVNPASAIANAIAQASQANAANSFSKPSSLSSRLSISPPAGAQPRSLHDKDKPLEKPLTLPPVNTAKGKKKAEEVHEVIYISSSPPPLSPLPMIRTLTPPVSVGLPPTPISVLPAFPSNPNSNGAGTQQVSSQMQTIQRQQPRRLLPKKKTYAELHLQTPTPTPASASASSSSSIHEATRGPGLGIVSSPSLDSALPTPIHSPPTLTHPRQHPSSLGYLVTPLPLPTLASAPAYSAFTSMQRWEEGREVREVGPFGTIEKIRWQTPLTPKSLEPPDYGHRRVEVDEYMGAYMEASPRSESQVEDILQLPSPLQERERERGKSFLISADEVERDLGEVGYGVHVEVVDCTTDSDEDVDEVTAAAVVEGSSVWTLGEPQTMLLVDRFLERFVCAFDTDRSSLEGIYTSDSWFTYRVIRRRGSTTTTATESTTRRGPRDIVHTLKNTLLRGYRFSWNNVSAQLARDYVVLGAKAGGGILLNVHGEVRRDPEASLTSAPVVGIASASSSLTSLPAKPVRVSQVFLLNGSRDGEVGLGLASDWPPFEVISHQMVVQEGSLNCSDEGVLEEPMIF